VHRPDLCGKPFEALMSEMSSLDAKNALRVAQSKFLETVHPHREKRLQHYESLVEKKLTASLKEVMASFDAQAESMTRMKERLKGTPLEAEIEKAERKHQEVRASAQRLQQYIATPRDQRIKPALDFSSLFGSAGKQDWDSVVKSYDSFLLR
jgi:hypothetical protein